MASSLVLKVATVTSTYTSSKTDAETAQILEWFIADVVDPMPEGMTVAQQNQWKLDQATAEIRRYIVRKAAQNRERMLNVERGDVTSQAATETAF